MINLTIVGNNEHTAQLLGEKIEDNENFIIIAAPTNQLNEISDAFYECENFWLTVGEKHTEIKSICLSHQISDVSILRLSK